MYEGLIFLAMMLFAALTARLAAEVCNLEEIVTSERREKYRQIAYAAMSRERTVKQNREKLWEENVNVR